MALVRFLRTRCPWDEAQTPRTLVPHLLEEANEVAEAVLGGDVDAVEGELGDLLLNVAFQVVLGEEGGILTADSVVSRLEGKMRRRHPHLFGIGEREDWERLKSKERGTGGTLEGLVQTLDPLARAHRIQERVAGVGFDWSDYRGAWDKVGEELDEVAQALDSQDQDAVDEELGDLLFAVVNLVRLSGLHATTALDRANRKFVARFERLERLAAARGISLEDADLERLDALWEELKRADG